LAEAMYLHAEPRDPTLDLPADMVQRLERLAAAMPNSALTGEDQYDAGVDAGLLALARWSPHALGALVRRGAAAAAASSLIEKRPNWFVRTWRQIRKADAGPRGRLVGVQLLPASLPLLGASELAPWRELSREAREQDFEAGFDLHCAALADAPASKQIALFRELPSLVLPEKAVRLLAAPTAAELEAVAVELDAGAPAERLRFWLAWLETVAAKTFPRGWPALAALVDHPESEVRSALYRLIWMSEDRELADVLERSGWRFENGMSREEAAWGTLAMTLSTAAAAGDIGARIHPDGLGELAERYPEVRAYRDAFADYVFSEIEHYQTAKSRTYPRALLTGRRGWNQLLEDHGRSLITWLYPFTLTDQMHWFFFEEFPCLHALETVDLIAPGFKARAVTTALREAQSSNFRSGDLYHQATRLPGPTGEEARQLALGEANDDRKLFDFARGLQEQEQTDWLLTQIRRDLASPTVGVIARGLTLAGFLLPDASTDRFWEDVLSLPPATGWLTEVHAAARERYERFRWAQHWNRMFQRNSDPDTLWASWKLLVASADERFYLAERPSEEDLHGWPWRKQHLWTWGWDSLKAEVKKRSEELAKLFLSTKPPLSNQSPRRR
jgi:hypothetical protein